MSDKRHKYTECLGVIHNWRVCRRPDIMPSLRRYNVSHDFLSQARLTPSSAEGNHEILSMGDPSRWPFTSRHRRKEVFS